MKFSARAVKSSSQSNLLCSNFTMTRLWKARASVQNKHSSTKLTACSNPDLPEDSLSPQSNMMKVKHEKNLAKLMFSLVISSPSSSLAIVWGHNSVFTTGLFFTLAPDLTFLL
ncbi:unnamed protein product [Meganyctiphanes norvegica]|uniref:Uncharacterized protein n=1 Tax=Meganyctiphanes norvegica TaxID=48144 RepID=A0AAV2Q0K1_MEGNR